MTGADVSSADIFALAETIDGAIRTRGFDLALPEELAQEMLALRTAQAALDSRIAMNARILACLKEYQAQLIAQGAPSGRTPALRERWQRYEAAWGTFCHRVDATQREADLRSRVLYDFLSQVRGLVAQGVV